MSPSQEDWKIASHSERLSTVVFLSHLEVVSGLEAWSAAPPPLADC